ncbi:WD40-repeat-containing domain protein [Globomyces pollinis-pini]|nr:WD40-repeat-containing domain protein [Globomyces pollinis-pini]
MEQSPKVQLPVHLIVRLTGTGRMLLISGSHIIIVDAATGSILATTEQLAPAKISVPKTQLSKQQIRSAVYHRESDRIAFVSDDKELQIWNASTLKRINTRQTVKRATCLLFSADGKQLLVGDKFGDVYRFDVNDPSVKPLLLLGHVSILTDMAWSLDSQYLLTADRDEKIRVNHYPATYDIHQFCLGHTEFVSKLIVLPGPPNVKQSAMMKGVHNLLISGGGDDFLCVWDYETGKLLQKLDFVKSTGLELGELKPSVTCLRYHQGTQTLGILLEKCDQIVLFDTTDMSNIKFKKLIKCVHQPLQFSFDSNGNLWVANNHGEHLVDVVLVSRDYHFAPHDSPLISKVNAIKTDQVDTMFDLYEVGQLRKWSRWTPDPNFLGNQKKRTADFEGAVDENKKKSRRAAKPKSAKKEKETETEVVKAD